MSDLQALDVETLRRGLEHDGYVVIRDVVSKETLTQLNDDLQGEYRRMSTSGEMFEGGGVLSGHLNCFPGKDSKAAYDELEAKGVFDLVRQLRPEQVDRRRVTLNFNLPGSVAQHYHMDGLYLGEFLICNIAVVDTDLVNGAIDVLPGTNREFYKFWRYAVQRKYKLTTRIPMNQGDIVLRLSTLWHRGMPNRSDVPRPMMAVTFGEFDEPTADPFAVNGGEIEFYPNWYNTSRLGQLRERTFVAAPISYSAYRFVRSLYGNKGYESF